MEVSIPTLKGNENGKGELIWDNNYHNVRETTSGDLTVDPSSNRTFCLQYTQIDMCGKISCVEGSHDASLIVIARLFDSLFNQLSLRN